MDIKITTTDEGFPQIKWTQDVAYSSNGAEMNRKFTRYGLAILAVSVMLFFGGSFYGAFYVFFIGGTVLALKVGPPLKGETYERWKLTPVTEPRDALATAVRYGNDLQFQVIWAGGTRSDGAMFEVPLNSFDAFEMGTLDDWFRQPGDIKRFMENSAIVIHPREQESKCVALHYRPRGELRALHEALTRVFIIERPAILAHLARLTAASPNLAAQAVPPQPALNDDDDVPDRL